MRRNKKNPKTNAGASDVVEATASRKQKPTMAMLKEPPPPGTQNRRRRCWKSHPFPETSRTTTIERCDAETYVDQETPSKSQMLKTKKRTPQPDRRWLREPRRRPEISLSLFSLSL
ncbi:hypothetical protein F2Q70_00034293 [Brassica cretica]|uniref:Uncharacterized protein n=1 Tax=Brassica cretica TaxID=69181 RepID=A0A8S9JV70_BRACR|nr:hypothetical protein F2Q70_00034293 [Brassica cretica]